MAGHDKASIDLLHKTIWRYIDRWRQDRAGPWWEADLSLDIGHGLRENFGKEELVSVKELPGFLKSWPPKTQLRRLGTNNHFSMRPGPGMFPDYFYRNPNTDTFEWIVELKNWTLDGSVKLERQVEKCIEEFEKDARKNWKTASPYVFVFLAVNIPAHFAEIRGRNKYMPEEFLGEILKRLRNSDPLRTLGDEKRGDACAVIKRIDAEAASAELVGCVATPGFKECPHRPEGLQCEGFAPSDYATTRRSPGAPSRG